MIRMTVLTISYAPDFELCSDLNQSVIRYAPEFVDHHIIVPASDVELFSRLTGARTHIRCEDDLLPRSFLRVPLSHFRINVGRPLPPVRGWILQQILKLAAAAASEDDIVLVVDSDIEFIRPTSPETFVRDGIVRFYRRAHAVHERMPRHVAWHRGSRSLLGLPPRNPPFADYVSSLMAWDPAIVRRMLARVGTTTGGPWTSAIAGQLHFSEWTLYGVFVDEVANAPHNSFASADPLCLAYWDDTPLDKDGAIQFISAAQPTDVAAMISAKSRTPLEVRRAAFVLYRDQRSAA